MTDEFGSGGGWEVPVRNEHRQNWLGVVTYAVLFVALFAFIYFSYFMLAAWVGGALLVYTLFSGFGHVRGDAWAKAGTVVLLADVIVLCVAQANHDGYISPIPHVAIVAVGLTLVVIGGVLKKRGK